MSESTLLERYAKRLGISPEAARLRLFAAATPAWRRPFIKLFELVLPGTFRIDWSAIDDAGRARSAAEVGHAVEIFRYRTRGDRSWLRMRLGFRVSGKRIFDFAAAEFAEPTTAGKPPAPN